MGIHNGGYGWHICVLEGPKSSEFTIQTSLLVKKFGLLRGGPDVGIFNLECDFMSWG
jgi:hypothetical protein